MRLLLQASLLLLLPSMVSAQIAEDFSDGDIIRNPPWTGTVAQWTVDDLGGDATLRTNGLARSDTLYLTTPSTVSVGTWSLSVAFRDVNLSTFNGVRVFLTADTSDLDGVVRGYYLQLGTNNTDEIRLYRMDGDPRSARVELGRSTPRVEGDDGSLNVTVQRTSDHRWTVVVDRDTVITALDSTYTTSKHFGIWVRHTRAAHRSFFFDDIVVRAPEDVEPPQLTDVVALDARTVRVVFNEPTYGCASDRYLITPGIGHPESLACGPGTRSSYDLALGQSLRTGVYTLTVTDVGDTHGNVLRQASAAFVYTDGPIPAKSDVVVNEILYAPAISGLEFVELYNRTNHAFDLGTLTLSDARSNPSRLAGAVSLLHPGDYVVLVQDSIAFRHAFPGVPCFQPDRWPTLNNNGDAVVVRAGGVVIDSVRYSPSWGGGGVSLERIDPDGASDDPSNFGSSRAGAGATPGTPNSLLRPEDTAPPKLTHVAAQDGGTMLKASFSEPLDTSSVTTDRFALDPHTAPTIIRSEYLAAERAVVLGLAGPLEPGSYTLIVRRIRDAAGNDLDEGRMTFDVVQSGPPPARHDVVINEVMYDPPSGGSEYIELFNRSTRTLDLSRFLLSDDRLDARPLVSRSRALPAGGFVVLVEDGTAFEASFPGVAYIHVSGWPALNNSGDTPVLWYDEAVVDSVPYRPRWGGRNVALERRDPRGPSYHPLNFGSTLSAAGGTPGGSNSILHPDTVAPVPVFAEVSPHDASIVSITFDELVRLNGMDGNTFALESGRGPEAVVPVSDDLHGTARVELRFESPVSGLHLQVRNVTDLTGNVLRDTIIPLAYVALPGQLVINEIMYAPRTGYAPARPDQTEYVELVNAAPHFVSLENVYWSGTPDADGRSSVIRFGEHLRALAPGAFAVVFADTTNGPPAVWTIARAFPGTPWTDGSVVAIPISGSTLGLLNEGSAVTLRRSDGLVIDSVFFAPSWHHPNLVETAGIALERFEPERPPNDPASWTSSVAPGGGTPGRINSVFVPVDARPRHDRLVIEPLIFSPDGDGLDDRAAIRYELKDAEALLRVRIFDSRGRLVRRLEPAYLAGGDGPLYWNGRDDEGRALPVGIYIVHLEALITSRGTSVALKEPVVLAYPFD